MIDYNGASLYKEKNIILILIFVDGNKNILQKYINKRIS